jgi:hypothetical protein
VNAGARFEAPGKLRRAWGRRPAVGAVVQCRVDLGAQIHVGGKRRGTPADSGGDFGSARGVGMEADPAPVLGQWSRSAPTERTRA